MQSEATHLFDQAMKLPVAERESLAEKIYLSLHPSIDPQEAQDGVDTDWSKEISRRVKDIKSDNVPTISAEEAHRKLRNRVGH